MLIKRRFYLAFFILTAFSHLVAAQNLSRVVLTVDERRIVKPYEPGILGLNFDWTGQQIAVSNGELRPDLLELLRGFPINLSRVSGTNSQYLSWKKAIGPLAGRPPQKLEKWRGPFVVGYGPVEWIKQVRAIDPKAKLVWCVNLMEDPQEAADLAEFLTGDPRNHKGGGENWAARRVALGIEQPVSIYAWELGNESDGTDAYVNYPTIQSYIDRCRKVMAAIKRVDPGARFAAQASTMNHQKDYKEKYGGDWKIWHQTVLKELGSEIDFLVYHPYFGNRHFTGTQPDNSFFTVRQKIMENDIQAITGSNRIRFLITEWGFWPEKAPGQTRWEQSWYTTHALVGCLSSADWINRMLASRYVAAAAMHSLSSGPWGIYYNSQRDDTGKSQPSELYLTGQADLFRLINKCFEQGKDVVAAKASGDQTNLEKPKSSFSAGAVTAPAGLRLLLVNQENFPRKVEFAAQSRYTLSSWQCLAGNSLEARNDSRRREIQTTTNPGRPGEFKDFEMPARSVAALWLTRL